MKNAKIILIGKYGEDPNIGPENIMRCLEKQFIKEQIEHSLCILNEGDSKILYVFKLVKCILISKNSIINVHTNGFLIVLLVYFLSFLNDTNRYYLTVHGIYQIDSFMSNTQKKLYMLLEYYLYKNFPNLICVSKMLQEDIKKIYKREKNIYVIPNATDAYCDVYKSKLNYPEKCLKFIMVGGLKNIKGIKECIELCDFLHKKKLNFSIDIYGYKENNYEWFCMEIKRLKLEKNVHYKGKISDKKLMYHLIADADFQVCLSHYDTFNVAVAESLVLGCPCISSNKCGASYLIKNGYNGIVVEINKHNCNEKIYQYICTFIEKPEKRMLVFNDRYSYVEQLSWHNICNKYINL